MDLLVLLLKRFQKGQIIGPNLNLSCGVIVWTFDYIEHFALYSIRFNFCN